jgi:hypothetical protein
MNKYLNHNCSRKIEAKVTVHVRLSARLMPPIEHPFCQLVEVVGNVDDGMVVRAEGMEKVEGMTRAGLTSAGIERERVERSERGW